MQYAIATDYREDYDPGVCLERIAQAGFSHIHWCHHWSDDFLYSEPEIERIRRWMDTYGLKMNDCHGSAGREKVYYSFKEYERMAGVELIKNRIHFTERLGGNVLVMHLYTPDNMMRVPDLRKKFWRQVFKSFDEIKDFCLQRNVGIAIENLRYYPCAEIDHIWDMLFERYDPVYIGLCYDSGHGATSDEDVLDLLEKHRDRILAIHLHDNDGYSDLHMPLFSTNVVDWARLAGILADSAYNGAVTLEVSIESTRLHWRTLNDEIYFLKRSYQDAVKFGEMIKAGRKKK